jgi:hypothetical protein
LLSHYEASSEGIKPIGGGAVLTVSNFCVILEKLPDDKASHSDGVSCLLKIEMS